MDGQTAFRIVLLGESGNGKSSLANTIFGESMFAVKNFNNTKSFVCEAKTKLINRKKLTLIDTPGLFDSGKRSQKEVQSAWETCIIECAPGPHVFLIVLKVEKYTEQEKVVVTKILEKFTDDVLKYAVVVFTHGDQLPEGMKIEEYVDKSDSLRELVEKCGGRCHVFDNKYWKNNQEDDYRSNRFQVAELLNTIDKMWMENRGEHYTNAELNEAERKIQEEAKLVKMSSENLSEDEIRQQAKNNILKKEMNGSIKFWMKSLLTLALPLIITALIFRLGERPLNSSVTLSPSLSPPEFDAPLQEVVEDITEKAVSVTLPVGDIDRAVEDGVPNAFEEILNKLCALFERVKDFLNLFE